MSSKVAVIWDIMLDVEVRYQKVPWRVNPEKESVPLVTESSKQEHRQLGGAANLAANIKWLLEDVLLIWPLNHDENSKKLIELCKKYHIDFKSLNTHSKTIVKKRVYAGNDYAMRIDEEEPIVIDSSSKQWIVDTLKQYTQLSHIVISDYAKGTVDKELVDVLKQYSVEHNIKLLVDTKPKNIHMFSEVYVLKPNFKEFVEMIGKSIPNEDEAVAIAWQEFVNMHKTNLIVTRGEHGATVVTKDGEVSHLHTQANRVADVTWAGDTFLAGVTAWDVEGMSLQEAVEYGNKASGIAVMRQWTTVVTRDDMKK